VNGVLVVRSSREAMVAIKRWGHRQTVASGAVGQHVCGPIGKPNLEAVL
jgi:hypothetical protein